MSKTVVVTGANRGLGLEFARQYAGRGDRVIAIVRDASRAAEVASVATVMEGDVADEASIDALGGELEGEGVDILVNNAGVMGEDKKIGGLKAAELGRVFAVNTFGPVLLTQRLLGSLKLGGTKKVANISSELGSTGQNWPNFSYAYCASKAALNRATAQMARELKREGVIVTAFCPGWNKTDMGGAGATLEPRESVGKLIALIDGLSASDSGKFIRHDGGVIPW